MASVSNQYSRSLSTTPLVPVQLEAQAPVIWCKLEFLNPSGSTKDRIARYILEKALREGRLRQGMTVIEASSGSTSIAMALACAQLGLRFIAVMPEGVSSERVLIIRAYGGEIRLTPKGSGVHGSILETERLAGETGGFLPRQFTNPENAEAHRLGTAREILEQIPAGTVDAVVSGVGTGGTLVGLYQGLRQSGCQAKPFLARPVDLSGSFDVECCSFSCRIPGVVECISTIFSAQAVPDVTTIEVPDLEAIETARRLVRLGFPVGPSSGLNFRAAVLASRELEKGAAIVTVFPDRMERYFTTDLFKPYQA
ncbi:MAG: cysteine synthase family protein [Bryobacteraceae bacterium]